MPRARAPSLRRLPDGSPLHNRLLAALPRAEYDRILQYMRMTTVTTGHTLHAHRARIKDVYFPNGGVFSVTNEMRQGLLVEVATVGREGMLGIGVFFGDRTGIGRTFQQVSNGPLPSMTAARFVKETASAGPFRNVVNLYAQASLLQIMQCTACNALYNVHPAGLSLAAPDARPRRGRYLRTQAGIPRRDARRAASHRHRCPAGAPARRVDLEPLRADPNPAPKATRSGLVRVLRCHPRAFRASRTVTQLLGMESSRVGRLSL